MINSSTSQLTCTGGPRYSRAQHSRFHLFAVEELVPKLDIRGPFSRLFAVFEGIVVKIKHKLTPIRGIFPERNPRE
jgi:hypothetical protein